MDIEAAAKEEAKVLFFVVDRNTRGIASMVEVSRACCVLLLFVSDSLLHALICQAAELIASGRKIVLIIQNMPKGARIGGRVCACVHGPNRTCRNIHMMATAMACSLLAQAIDDSETKDLNRGRDYLRDVARRHGVQTHDSVEEGLKELLQLFS